ncbi:hypothetical protein [Limnobacter sp.]|jgi:hypothetical protein|uniref:hypothetical protein n=1 Tax=Limnobacter sp. TaxID=2003368 RepID=UPI0025C68D41|nr:hypothetical protein [Limnobacter sp.]
MTEKDLLELLHESVAKDLLARVQSGEASPAELNAAIKFLKDNGIEALQKEDSPLAQLAGALPVFEEDIRDVN